MQNYRRGNFIFIPCLVDLPDPYADYAVAKRTWIPQMHRRAPRVPDLIPIDPRSVDPRNTLEFLHNYQNDIPDLDQQDDFNDMYQIVKFLNDMQLSPIEIRDILSGENREKLQKLLERFEYEEPRALPLQNSVEQPSETILEPNVPDERFTLNYNTPDNFRNGWESRDTLQPYDEEDLTESRVYSDEEDPNGNTENREYGSGHDLYSVQDFLTAEAEASTDSEIFRELSRQMKNGRNQVQPAVYSEGGVVWSEPIEDLKETTQEEANPLVSLDKLFLNYNMGFKRPERLDVKKPGPPFDAQISDNTHKGKYYFP